jgi:hypothetical protein
MTIQQPRVRTKTYSDKRFDKTASTFWNNLPPPFFLTFCLQIYFQSNFFISLLFHLFVLILTCSCQYPYNLMLTSNCMCRPYIDTNKRSWHGLTAPLFSNFLLTNLFSIKFLYFFIISSLFPYFNLFVSIFVQSYANIKLYVPTLYRY